MMLWTSLLSAAAALECVAATSIAAKSDKVSISHNRVKAFAPATSLEKTDNYVSLARTNTKAPSSAELSRNIHAAAKGIAPLRSTGLGSGYGVNIEFGGSTVSLLLDTGSADTWIAQANVNCTDEWGDAFLPASDCGFGPLYNGTFPEGEVANENFNISYGDGEFLTGALGYADVSIAGITVKHQEIALVDYAYWNGDNVTSGLTGFAYPALTSAFEGTDPTADNINTTQDIYDSFVSSAGKQGLFTSFSLALERGSTGVDGYLALGGLPPCDVGGNFTSTPIMISEFVSSEAAETQYTFYSIQPDGFLFGAFASASGHGTRRLSAEPEAPLQVIVDSGTTLMFLPAQLTEEINSLFDPPAIYIPEEGVFETTCDATPPTLAIRINGTDFYINPEDMLFSTAPDSDTGGCLTAIQPMYQEPYILGDTFLKNVVAVFDVGAGEMRFAPRVNY